MKPDEPTLDERSMKRAREAVYPLAERLDLAREQAAYASHRWSGGTTTRSPSSIGEEGLRTARSRY